MSIKEIMIKRRSMRTYKNEPIGQESKEKLETFIKSVSSPFGIKTRFTLLDADDMGSQIRLGTYGIISGAKTFICAVTELGQRYEENLGYAFERIILHATSLNLGTCWLGGTFNRSRFAKAVNLKENEILPIVSPVGYAKESRSLIDSFFVRSSGSNNRKDWSELFFDRNFERPLAREKEEKFKDALDMVRIAPSASNKQPWRIVKCGEEFHFCLSRTPGYKGILGFDIQRLDIGIAMCHFEMMMNELGISGKWIDSNPGLTMDKNTEYIITYACKKQEISYE